LNLDRRSAKRSRSTDDLDVHLRPPARICSPVFARRGAGSIVVPPSAGASAVKRLPRRRLDLGSNEKAMNGRGLDGGSKIGSSRAAEEVAGRASS